MDTAGPLMMFTVVLLMALTTIGGLVWAAAQDGRAPLAQRSDG